jgi:hypothetical protein
MDGPPRPKCDAFRAYFVIFCICRLMPPRVRDRCPVESLTMNQLQEIFSGQMKDWMNLGGTKKAIHRYGPVFLAARCGTMILCFRAVRLLRTGV